MEISNKTLASILVVAVVVSLAGTIVSLNKLNRLGTGFTGQVTGTGTASLNVSTTASLVFYINSVDFGTGYVNVTAGNNCSMQVNASATNTRTGPCVGFNASVSPYDTLIIQNNGNINLNVTLNISKNATNFIGGASGIRSFKWAVGDNESGACNGGTLEMPLFTEINTTQGGASPVRVCSNLSYAGSSRSLRVGLNVTIPSDATQGGTSAILEATGVALTG